MNIKQLKSAEKLYQTWTTAQLVKATTVDKQDYLPEAIGLMMEELSKRGLTSSEHQNLEQQAIKESENRLTGVRGFLLLFCLVVLVNSIAIIVASIYTVEQQNQPQYNLPIFLRSLSAAYGVYGVFVFYTLVRRMRSAPLHAKWFLRGDIVFTFLVAGFFNIPTLLIGIVTPLIWLSYLNNSRRVAKTYLQ